MRLQKVSIIIANILKKKKEKIVDNLTGGMLKRVTFKKIIVYRRRYSLKFLC
jgi:hypothetical protein